MTFESESLKPSPSANGLQGYWFLIDSFESSTIAPDSSTPTSSVLGSNVLTNITNATLIMNAPSADNSHLGITAEPSSSFWIGVMLAIATLSLVFLLAQHVQCVAVVQNEDQSLYPALTLWIMQPQLLTAQSHPTLLPQDPFEALNILRNQPNFLVSLGFRFHLVRGSHTRDEQSGSLQWTLWIAGLAPRRTLHSLLSEARQNSHFTSDQFVIERCEGRASWRSRPSTKKPFNWVLDLAIGVNGKRHLLEDLRNFLEGESVFADLGLDYSRVYKICGPSGTCKSSTAQAICTAIGRRLYVWDMGDNPLHEEDTEQLLTQIPLGSGVHLRLRMGPEPSRSSILQAETLTKRLRLIHGCIIFVTGSNIPWINHDIGLMVATVPTLPQLRLLMERTYNEMDRTTETKEVLSELADIAAQQIKAGTRDLPTLRQVLLRHPQHPDMAISELKSSGSSIF